MLLAERQLKLIEKLIIANESQIDDMYNYFFKQEKISSTSSEKSHKNYYFTGKDLAESRFVGLWNNKNIDDSQKFAKELRTKSQNRIL